MGRASGVPRVSSEQVRRFRLARHNLHERRELSELVDVAGACAVQNSPPGSAAVALHARVGDVTLAEFDRAVENDKTLVQTWCMRGSPFFFPTTDMAVFTTGVLPRTEQDTLAFVFGVGSALEKLGMGMTEAVNRTEEKLPDVLSGRELAINELGRELAEQIAGDLPPAQQATWNAQGPYAAGQPLGEGVVHFALRISTLRQTICLAPRRGNKAPFVVTREWLGEVPQSRTAEARRELLRRYLRCYGPSGKEHFASWAGISAADANHSWWLLEDELAEVSLDGNTSWLLAADVDTLESAVAVRGTRLLPSGDPYTQQRDRQTILADTSLHRKIWRSVGAPGTVLLDGRIVGAWNVKKLGKRLQVTVSAFESLGPHARQAIEHEAQAVAPLRRADRAEVGFA